MLTLNLLPVSTFTSIVCSNQWKMDKLLPVMKISFWTSEMPWMIRRAFLQFPKPEFIIYPSRFWKTHTLYGNSLFSPRKAIKWMSWLVVVCKRRSPPCDHAIYFETEEGRPYRCFESQRQIPGDQDGVKRSSHFTALLAGFWKSLWKNENILKIDWFHDWIELNKYILRKCKSSILLLSIWIIFN